MYSVKGIWAGQTFALTSASDSGGRKSRIRRSKEERKTMVETFIRRYQNLNNGKFPSLNLTHKEVGGSFYTVREIVRDIIQENRVLGPGQFSSKKHQEGNDNLVLNMDANGIYAEHQILDVVQRSTEHWTEEILEEDTAQFPSISCEDLGNFDQERANFELEVPQYSNEKCSSVNDTYDAHVVNHIETNEISEKSNTLLVEGSRESETSEVDGESEQTSAFQDKITIPTEEVEVETFPLTSAAEKSDDSSSTSTGSNNFYGNYDNSEINNVTLRNDTLDVDEISSFDASSDLASSKVADTSKVFVSGGSPDIIIKDAEVNHVMVQIREVNEEKLPFEDDIAILSNHMNQISAHSDSTSTKAEQNNLQPRNASNVTAYMENNNETSCKNAKETTVVNRRGLTKDEKAKVGSSPLDRIDLESWKASRQEINPLLAFFKAFIGAFSKLWSE